MKFKFSLIAKILAITYIVLLTLLAFDVPILSLDFLIHMVPSFILIGILILSWFKPKIGGTTFLILGIVFAIFFKSYKDIITFLLIPFPALIIGILFWLSKRKK